MTLLETIVGGAIMAVIMFALMCLYPTSLLGMRNGQDTARAANIAQRAMESARGRPFESLDPGGRALADEVVDGTRYAIREEIADRAADLKDYRVTVTWEVARPGAEDPGTASLMLETTLYDFHNP